MSYFDGEGDQQTAAPAPVQEPAPAEPSAPESGAATGDEQPAA